MDTAWELGATGQVEDGYAELDVGLAWAEAPPLDPVTGIPGLPDPWRDELVHQYRIALVRYCERFSVTFTDPVQEHRARLQARAAELMARCHELRQRSAELVERGRRARIVADDARRRRVQ